MENPSFNTVPATPRTEAPATNDWNQITSELNQASADFDATSAQDAQNIQEAPETQGSVATPESTDILAEATTEVTTTENEPARIAGTSRGETIISNTENEPAHVTGTNRDEGRKVLNTIASDTKDEPARVTGTNRDENRGTSETITSPTETTEQVADVTQEETTAPENLENRETNLDVTIIDHEYNRISDELVHNNTPEARRTQHFREMMQRQAVLLDASTEISYDAKNQPRQPDQMPSANEAFNNVAQKYLRLIDKFNQFSDQITDDPKLSKFYEKQAELAAWRSGIAVELANGGYEQIKNHYFDEAKSQENAPKESEESAKPGELAEPTEPVAPIAEPTEIPNTQPEQPTEPTEDTKAIA